MNTSNIERFDEITGKVLAALYQAFPVPTNLKAADFVEPAYCFDEILGADMPAPEAEFFIACVHWLAEAGYLRLKGDNYGIILEAVLTAKGLETLKAVPKSLEDSQSIGERLVEATRSGVMDQVRDLSNSALKRGIALTYTLASELMTTS